MLELANEELRKKERSMREVKKKQEIYEGKNLENKSDKELDLARKQLTEALKLVSSVLDRKNK